MDRNGVCCCGDGPGESGIVMWGMLVQMVVVDLLLGVAGRDGADGRGGSVARGCWS